MSGSVPVPSSSGFSDRPWRPACFGASDEIEDGGSDVDVLDRRADAAGRIAARQLDDERHVHRRVVEEQAVLLLAVIAETLAVIGQQHDRRLLVEGRRAQPIEQASDDLVRVSDLAVVRFVRRETRRRGIGFVRLVDVKEQEERLAAVAGGQPPLRGGQRVLSVALHLADRALARRRRQLAVVGVEPLVQADGGAQHVGRHEPGRRPAALLQRPLHEPLSRLDGEADVVADAVFEGEQAGQDARVRRHRLRRVRIGALEDRPLRGERVDVRRPHPGIAVGRQVIGAQRVDGNQDDRSVAGPRRPELPEHTGPQPELDQRDDADDDEHCLFHRRRARSMQKV